MRRGDASREWADHGVPCSLCPPLRHGRLLQVNPGAGFDHSAPNTAVPPGVDKPRPPHVPRPQLLPTTAPTKTTTPSPPPPFTATPAVMPTAIFPSPSAHQEPEGVPCPYPAPGAATDGGFNWTLPDQARPPHLTVRERPERGGLRRAVIGTVWGQRLSPLGDSRPPGRFTPSFTVIEKALVRGRRCDPYSLTVASRPERLPRDGPQSRRPATLTSNPLCPYV